MDEITVNQVMGEALVSRGLMAPEVAAADAAALKARLSGEPEPSPAHVAATPASVPAEASQTPVDPLDAMAFEGAASPADYNFPPPPRGVAVDMEQATAMRELFHSEGLPKPIGDHISTLWNAACAQPPTEADLERGYQECSAALTRMWGSETAKNLAVAKREVHRMAKTNPAILAMLDESGIGNSPWLAATLFNHARAKGRA